MEIKQFRSNSTFRPPDTRTDILAERFLQKGYNKGEIVGEIKKVGDMDRGPLVMDFRPKLPSKTGDTQLRISLDYNIQHKQFEKIVMKHWNILQKDQVLGTIIPPRPRFIYRKAPTLRDVIAPSVVDPPVVKVGGIFPLLTGFYACGRCPPCKKCRQRVKKRKEFVASTTGNTYSH